jgi:hypothetical protein
VTEKSEINMDRKVPCVCNVKKEHERKGEGKERKVREGKGGHADCYLTRRHSVEN